jgi:TrmH family RNA methyltransferase
MNNREEAITSKDNVRFKELLDVKENGKKTGLVLIEGEDLVQLAIRAGVLKKAVLLDYDYRYAAYPVTVLSRELYRELSSYNSLPKVIGVASFAVQKDIRSFKAVYLDGIQDPGNLGTIERTALAFGYGAVVLSADSVSPFNFKAVQASKGAMFSLEIAYLTLEEMKEKGYELYMTDIRGQDVNSVAKPEGKFAIVIGNEGQGIRPAHLALADEKVLLPINPEIDSLNASVAAGIFMFLWREEDDGD